MALGKNTKAYETPNHPYQGGRIAQEHDLVGRYGLKNKEELWRAESELRSYRREARELVGRSQGDAEEAARQGAGFLSRLKRLGILDEGETLGDVLSLDVTDVLERRLQTVVYRRGLANSPKQARQFISHGHVRVGDRCVRVPSYKVDADVESEIAFTENSALADDLHPERAEEQ